MARTKGEIRTAQLITTYGVGALIAVEDESFMVAGTDRWQVDPSDLFHEPRLERLLRAQGFARPPSSDDGTDIPVIRFPRWYSCPSCKRLERHRFFTTWNDNRCNTCEQRLVPSRFIVACPKGHADDFPYFLWVHAGQPRKDGTHQMRIEAGGATASLRDIEITCSCTAKMTMEGVFARTALQGLTRCQGRRPWLTGEAEEECAEVPRTLQRGASNVWFSVVRSAISIPPWSEGAYKVLARHWAAIKAVPEPALELTIEAMHLGESVGYTTEDLVRAVKERKAEESGELGTESLREQEFAALIRGRPETSRDQDFVCEAAPTVDPAMEAFFDQVMEVKRLREVRALEAFTRILPPGPADADRYAAISSHEMTWLPAIEVRGEGVFLRLSDEAVGHWEGLDSVKDRVALLNQRYRDRAQARGHPPDREITPRFVLLHTLAHALIDQWALDCGYSASALRERLYASGQMAGLLIYTATSDSAGSLGGVVAQAAPDRLADTTREAMSRAAWCSSDPLCIETGAQGVDALNRAACHACLLLPETSCEEMNVLLDRALLIGLPEAPELAFFGELVADD